jgi:6-phosphogluconolactonase
VQNKSWRGRVAISVGLAALLYTLGCGAGSARPASPQNTYLYVGGSNNPFLDPPGTIVTGSIFQFRVESDGTLTALNTSTTGPNLRAFATAISPGNQYLFASNGPISEFEIGSDGILGVSVTPAATGIAVAFTPNGQFALITNWGNNTLQSYSLSASGVLTPVNAVATGSYPQSVAVDGTGKFAYVANNNDGTISEYTISAGGVVTAYGSIPSGGYNPSVLVISHEGFLYCGNSNSGSASAFSIDASSGALTLVDTYTIWAVSAYGTGLGARWISVDPAGTNAYISNGEEIAQFVVDPTTGALTSNGTMPIANAANWGGVDPSGRFVFTANGDGTVSQFTIGSTGTLIPNGSVSLGADIIATVLTFAQR